MKKLILILMTLTVLVVTSCSPENLNDNEIQQVDKSKNVRPGNQGG